MTESSENIRAQAVMHHAYFLGLQLMIATNKGPDVMGKWMFRLFRRQHLDKFLSSFDKLGLTGLPDAVACAKYHVMSNGVGGVPVEYMAESDQKAWVRFRYPRWMYQGPTICGIPTSVSRGFLNGWYAYNGVSLGNPRLGYVCVSEDMTGEFGFCGYFKEYDYDLDESERLQFSKGELPPRFDAADQPILPVNSWSPERLAKANRNYAMDYIRNGIAELVNVIGYKETSELGGRAAKLIGLQYLQETMAIVNCEDADCYSAGQYLQRMMDGVGDTATLSEVGAPVSLKQTGLRIVRGLAGEEREAVLHSWLQLWHGALSSYRVLKKAELSFSGDEIRWEIFDRQSIRDTT